MGEAEFESKALVEAVHGALAELATVAAEVSIGTPGGRFQVRWDEGGSATALGRGLFAEFLEVRGCSSAGGVLPDGLHQPECPATRDAGHLAALHPGRSAALRSCGGLAR
ncbi:MAG: hypothetical protein IPJ73_20585 [Zoogloea sp.]|nr:hypothetical protein [Zoogloea sp.]